MNVDIHNPSVNLIPHSPFLVLVTSGSPARCLAPQQLLLEGDSLALYWLITGGPSEGGDIVRKFNSISLIALKWSKRQKLRLSLSLCVLGVPGTFQAIYEFSPLEGTKPRVRLWCYDLRQIDHSMQCKWRPSKFEA